MSAANEGSDLISSEAAKPTRTRSLRVPVSIDDRVHLAMEAAGLSFTQFVLLALEKSSDQVRDLLIDRSKLTGGVNADHLIQTLKAAVEELNASRNEVRRVGINMNQIARQLNITGDAGEPLDMGAIRRQVRAAEAALESLSKNVDDLDGQLYRARYAVNKTSVTRRRRPEVE